MEIEKLALINRIKDLENEVSILKTKLDQERNTHTLRFDRRILQLTKERDSLKAELNNVT